MPASDHPTEDRIVRRVHGAQAALAELLLQRIAPDVADRQALAAGACVAAFGGRRFRCRRIEVDRWIGGRADGRRARRFVAMWMVLHSAGA